MADATDPKGESPDAYFDRLDAAFSALSATPRTGRPGVPVANEPVGPSLIAETFSALLALDEGAPGDKPMRLVSSESEPKVTEAFVEEVTRRVVERLAPDVVRAVVADVVSEVSERLVKEEIARIRQEPNV
jgi:hypothetical protein